MTTSKTNRSPGSSSSSSSSSISNKKGYDYDIIIIGGGVIGCAVLRAATLQGYKCLLVEAESHLLSHASGSNSGIACTGVDASPNTLERALIRESNSLFRLYCKEHNVPFRPCGSIVCLWPWDDDDSDHLDHDHEGLDDASKDKDSTSDSVELTKCKLNVEKDAIKKEEESDQKLSLVYDESYDANDTHVQKLTPSQIQSMEPNISKKVKGGVHIPGEIVVDPWLYSISLAVHARENGGVIYTNCKFDSEESAFDENSGMWKVVLYSNNSNNNEDIEDDDYHIHSCNNITTKKIKLRARAVVNAAGLWSDTIQKQTFKSNKTSSTENKPHKKNLMKNKQSRSSWIAKPRRGQYRIYKPSPQSSIQHPIQPVPTQRTKGIFVFSSFYNDIVVGPTALDQSSKTDKSIDPLVAYELDCVVKRIIPNVDVEKDCIGEYVGIRPGTDKRDYQIHLCAKKHWIDVAGIRSTGLTASLGIGNYVIRNLAVIFYSCCDDDKVDDEDNVDGGSDDEFVPITTPLPSTETLIQEYQQRGDGMVTIHGYEYKVTHKLTQLGWRRYGIID